MPFDILIGRDEEEKQKFGTKGLIFIGKHYVKMGQVTSLSNNVYLDVARSHVVFIVGKRGSGKCVTGDTRITLVDGSVCLIKELEQKKEHIFALNHDLKIIPSPKTRFYKRTVSTLLRVILRSGRTIELTPEHPLLSLSGWKEAKELFVGSRIATPRIIPCFGTQSMPEAEIKIIAYLLTEGHTKKPLFFSNLDPIIISDFTHALKEFHPLLELTFLKEGCYKVNSRNIKRSVLEYTVLRNSEGRFERGTSIEHEKTLIRKLMEQTKLYGKLAIEKEIPEGIFTLPKNQLALFLNRCFSCDGSIYRSSKKRNYWEISYATSSKEFARQMHHLLLRFGILSKLRNKTIKRGEKIFKSFEIVCDGENVKNFIHEIGFFGQKQEKQDRALFELQHVKNNPNVDTIPKELWDEYTPKNWTAIGRELGYAYPKAARESMRYAPSRQKLLQIAIADSSERMKALAQSDIFWDEIKLIEEKQGSFDVYDITVPEYHNFIANDIIIHNSYTMGIIAEGVADLPTEVSQNIAVIMLDTMGVYWTMKYPNLKDEELLSQWGLHAKGLNVVIYTPTGYFKEYKDKGIPTDFPFGIRPGELDAGDWMLSFGLTKNDDAGVLIERVIFKLKQRTKNFSVSDIIREIQSDTRCDQHVRDIAENHFLGAQTWGVFDENAQDLSSIAKGGQVAILDVSAYATLPGGWEIKSLVVGLISKRLFIDRMIARKNEEYQMVKETVHYFSEDVKTKQEMPLVWLVIDEAHEFLPREGTTAATAPLITLLREGRQPGISLILASQQPGKIHTDVMTQSDTVIAHRITAKLDVDALGMLMQSYMQEGLVQQLDNLPSLKGSAIIFDDTNERMYPLRLRPRLTWHGGSSPVAIKEEKKN